MNDPRLRLAILQRAVSHSESLCERRQALDVLAVPHSLCLATGRTADHNAGLVRHAQFGMIGLVALGATLFAVLFFVTQYIKRLPETDATRWAWIALAAFALAGSIGCFVMAAISNVRHYRKEVGARYRGYVRSERVSKPLFAEISYPPTVSDESTVEIHDQAFVICASDQRRVIIEGIVHRHVIRAEDVLAVETVQARPPETMVELEPVVSLRIRYRIDPESELVVGLQRESLLDALAEKHLGQTPLFQKVRETLGS